MINEYEQNNRPLHIQETLWWILTDERISVSFPKETKPLYPCEKFQIKGKHLESYLCMPRSYCLAKFMGPI